MHSGRKQGSDMRSKPYYIFTMMLVMLVTCVSCRQELCYDHYPSVNISFTWEREWERDYGMNLQSIWDPVLMHWEYDEMRPEIPEWIKLLKYSDDGRITERLLSPEGLKLEVEQDENSSMLLYNGDTEYIIVSDIASINDVRASASTRTRSGSSMQEMKEVYKNTRTTNPPDVIYSAFIERIPGGGIHEEKPLPINMQPLVYTYIVTYEFEHGLEYVVLARGALGGMAEGVYLRTGVTTDDVSIILFDCDVHSDACRSRVHSFGIPGFPDSYFGRTDPPESTQPFILNLEVKLRNGNTKEFNFDISDQIKNQPRGGVIKVGGLRIEDEEAQPPSGGGIDVDVSDWGDNTDIIDVPLD